jgi:hypothetical protein
MYCIRHVYSPIISTSTEPLARGRCATPPIEIYCSSSPLGVPQTPALGPPEAERSVRHSVLGTLRSSDLGIALTLVVSTRLGVWQQGPLG